MFKFVLIGLIAVVAILGTAYLMARLLRESRDRSKYITVAVILLLVFFVFIIPSFILTKFLTIWEVFDYVVSQLNEQLGLNLWFSRAIVILLIGPFIWGLSRLLSLKGEKRKIGMSVVVAYLAAYFVAMGIGAQGSYDSEGRVIQWLELSADGMSYRLLDHGGINRHTGDSLIEMSGHLTMVLADYDKDDDDVLELEGALVHPVTGEGLVCYAIEEGKIVIHEAGGFDPATGIERLLITPEIARQYLNQDKAQRASDSAAAVTEEQRQAEARAERIRIEQKQEEQRRIEQQQRAERQRLIDLRDQYLSPAGERGLTADEASLHITLRSKEMLKSHAGTTESFVREKLQERYTLRRMPFSYEFFTAGHLDALASGETAMLNELAVENVDGLVVVVDISESDNVPPTMAGMKSMEMICQIQGVTLAGELLVDRYITAKGIGNSDATALRQAVDDLKRQLQEVEF